MKQRIFFLIFGGDLSKKRLEMIVGYVKMVFWGGELNAIPIEK